MTNPLTDSVILNSISLLLKAVIIAGMPLLILAFLVVGIRYMLARGSADIITQNSKLFAKLLLYTVLLLGASLIFYMGRALLLNIAGAI